ncbi:hypothetical protein F4825DRAFT_240552 [Nemania diffusa]|nr:hypothetical protein F4825DRAFT_240552 [Nemania diffusa]
MPLISNSWVPEIIALVASAVSLAGLVGVLIAYDTKPIFSWHGITLNAVVSILATASKALLLLAIEELISQWKWILFTNQSRLLIDFERIDAASRGPLGSLILMLRCKNISYLYIGTLTVLTSLAIDPFAQQIVQNRQKEFLVDDVAATVAKAGRYSKGSIDFLQAVKFDPSMPRNNSLVYVDADYSMQSAVLYGLNQPLENVVQQASFKCPSAECVWPVYESLAVCAECHDITSSLEPFKSLGGLYIPFARDNPAVAVKYDGGTAFRLPNGLAIDNADGWVYDTDFNHWNSFNNSVYGAVLMSTFGTGNASETVTMGDINTLIWSMSIIRVTEDPTNSSAAWPALPISATECALLYCVKDYQDKVINGSFLESATPVANTHRLQQSWQPDRIFWQGDLSPDILSSIEFNSYFSVIQRTDLSILSVDTGLAYNISQEAVDSISSFIHNTFAIKLTPFNVNSNGSVAGQLNGYYIDTGDIQYSPSALQVLYKSEDLNATFTNLAASMSNALRSGADDSFNGTNREHTGQKSATTVIYSIQWPWITLHVFLVVVAPIFLLATLRSNSSPDQVAQAWKSSSLAVMNRGFVVCDVLEGARTVKEMEQRAKNAKVTLLAGNQALADKIGQLELDPLQSGHDASIRKHTYPSIEVIGLRPFESASSQQTFSFYEYSNHSGAINR